MAARTRRTTLNENWKEKIKTSAILNRVHKCAMGEIELSPVQLKAAEILLKKTIPDTKFVEATIDGNLTVTKIVREIVHANDQNP